MNRTIRVLDALTRTHVNLGRIAGVPVGLNASWFPVFFLVAWSLATGFIPHAAPGTSPEMVWIAALVGTTLFFASILAHEFGHALVAMHAGIGVSSVTLFVLGGVSRIVEEPRTAWEELRIAAAGPIVSLAAAGVFLGATPFLHGSLAVSIAIYLVLVNAALALFNLLPALPLDGGRVLRATIWAITGNPRSATRWAAWSGRAIGASFMAAGVAALLMGALVPAGWLLLLGVFIERSANGSMESDGEVEVRVQNVAQGLSALVMNEARFRRVEAKVIYWRARLDVLPRPGDLEAQTGDGSLVRRYQDVRLQMYAILDGIDVGLRSLMTDAMIESEFRKLDELHDEWRPASFAGEVDPDLPEAGEEAALAGRPERYAPSPEDVLAREPGSSIEV